MIVFYTKRLFHSSWLVVLVNFDEAGFQYKSIPQYSYVSKKTEIRAKKPIKARITGLFGATAAGHKFKPVIVGKAAKPRAFQRLKSDKKTVSDLPVHYRHSANAWMTAEIFRDWFLSCFLLEIGDICDENLRIELLLDNCTAHPTDLEELKPYVTITFLPPNTTSLI